MRTRTQALMGTFVHITLEEKYNTEISQSFNLIRAIEHSLSSYDKEALVYQLNHTHKITPDTYITKALKKSKQYYQDTQGYYDITIGSISKDLYHFGEEYSSIPSKDALQHAQLNIHAIEMNTTTISTDKNITIDLGGMGKGYAVDKVVDFLKEQNISQGIIALSGDIRCLGLCDFELQSPFSEQTFAQLSSKIPQLSISTSGTYRRYIKDKTHNHLINPKTAEQGKTFVSVSLFTHADNTMIDAYATAISVMPRKKALAFLKTHDEIGFVLVEQKGKIIYGNLEKFVTLKWLNYKEKATMPKSTKKSNTNNPTETSLIHPDTKNPKMIGK
jgi:thiamine biosynthesis lipoprotein